MSRLDQHVAKVQGKLLLTTLLNALAWSLLIYAGVVWLVTLVGRLISFELPRQTIWFFAGLGVAVTVALVYALRRKPTRQAAAVVIDQRLGLNEKFSTALHIRKGSDPFEMAAVRDAEATAEKVHLQDKFPVRFPRTAWFTAGMAVVAFLTGWLLQPMDLLGRKAEAAKLEQQEKQNAEVNQEIRKAIAKIESAPPVVQKDPKVEMAVRELKGLLNKPVKDPTGSSRKAQDALEEVRSQMQKVKDLQNAAVALNEMQAWKELASKPIDESGPVGKAQSMMAKGEFSKAVDLLKDTVNNIDKMDQKEQEKAAQQMAAMAQQMRDMANNPQQQKEMEKKLQQAGATQQQAQQMVQAMQQAANGDRQAQQQLQQMANQMMQQMNNGQGPSQQQIQQAQSLLNQLQQQANGQAQAQQLAQNAANMAKLMQQVAQQGQQARQGQNGQQQQAQQGQQAQVQGGQQGGQGQQQQQQGGQQGQQGGQQGNPGMQQAQAQMQQQLQQMQAMADAAQQGQGGQQPQDGAGQDGGDGQQMAQNGQPGGGEGQGQGDPNQGNGQRGGQGGQAGWGQANGAGMKPTPAPFDVKQELSNSQTIEKGKLLASNYVKASALKGTSKAQLKEVVESAETEAVDEVDQTRVSRQARQAVKEYHRSMAKEVGAEEK